MITVADSLGRIILFPRHLQLQGGTSPTRAGLPSAASLSRGTPGRAAGLAWDMQTRFLWSHMLLDSQQRGVCTSRIN